jgi:hypothetical protein
METGVRLWIYIIRCGYIGNSNGLESLYLGGSYTIWRPGYIWFYLEEESCDKTAVDTIVGLRKSQDLILCPDVGGIRCNSSYREAPIEIYGLTCLIFYRRCNIIGNCTINGRWYLGKDWVTWENGRCFFSR